MLVNGIKSIFLFRPIDERESKEIYTTISIDPDEPKFEKILIANRGKLLFWCVGNVKNVSCLAVLRRFVYFAHAYVSKCENVSHHTGGLFVLISKISITCACYVKQTSQFVRNVLCIQEKAGVCYGILKSFASRRLRKWILTVWLTVVVLLYCIEQS